MNEEQSCISGTQRRKIPADFAALLLVPSNLAQATLPQTIQFLGAVDKTQNAMANTSAEHDNGALELVTWLSDSIGRACIPWLGAEACSNLGGCFQAVQDRLEEVYASMNLYNACVLMLQTMLNHSTNYPHAAARLGGWCEEHHSTRAIPARTGRLREQGTSEWADVEMKVFSACQQLFAPPAQCADTGEAGLDSAVAQHQLSDDGTTGNGAHAHTSASVPDNTNGPVKKHRTVAGSTSGSKVRA